MRSFLNEHKFFVWALYVFAAWLFAEAVFACMGFNV